MSVIITVLSVYLEKDTQMINHPLKFFSAFLFAVLFPVSVSAISFFPAADMVINLAGNSTFNFDSYTISSDIDINYLAPKGSLIEIISEGDIVIDGSLSALDIALSLTTKKGSIFLSGNLKADVIRIHGGINIPDNNGTLQLGGNNGVVLENGSITVGTTNRPTLGNIDIGVIDISQVEIKSWKDPISINGGTIQIHPLTTSGVITLTPTNVPVPPSLILMITGLIALRVRFQGLGKGL